MPSVEQIACVCHEANRAWCQANDDWSQLSWITAPLWQRQSAIEGVEHALAGQTPEQLHASWYEAKLRDGWVYGAIKDTDVKTHPCLVLYADLPPEQVAKDRLFAAVVGALKDA